MSSSSEPLINSRTRIKVSSSLDRSVGRKHLTDGDPGTCWTSQQDLPQFIRIIFDSPVVPKTVHITFQGGFVGKLCRIGVLPAALHRGETPIIQELTTIYPEDVNWKQSFGLPKIEPIRQMNFEFEESSDFFGRITIYDLQVKGQFIREGDA
ncbi:hypothetical protein ACEPAH_1226 [Sanghuangporus vaninii]